MKPLHPSKAQYLREHYVPGEEDAIADRLRMDPGDVRAAARGLGLQPIEAEVEAEWKRQDQLASEFNRGAMYGEEMALRKPGRKKKAGTKARAAKRRRAAR